MTSGCPSLSVGSPLVALPARSSREGEHLRYSNPHEPTANGGTGRVTFRVRWLVVLKAIRRELYVTARPEVVQPVRLGGAVVDEDAVRGGFAFSVLYVVLFGVATTLVGLDAWQVGYELSTLEAVSASIATLGNVGPGFGSLGRSGATSAFPSPRNC